MSQSAAPAHPGSDSSSLRDDRFPPGIPFIVGNEGAERFSYYGMRAILKTYLALLYVKMLVTPELAGESLQAVEKAASSRATAVTHLFMAGVYAFPMIGALFADRLLGKYPVIFWLSLVYCAGHGVLSIAGHFDTVGNLPLAEYGFYVGLALIAIGSGGIKPCVSANVGDQFTARNQGLVTMVFQIFYFIINFGSFFATILIPILKDKFGPEVAFGVPGILMGIAAIIFWLGRKRFVRVPPKPGGTLGLLDSVASALFFAPVVAVIVAVFVVSDGYEAPSRALFEDAGAATFYGTYVVTYLKYLAVHSWVYFVIAAALVGVGAAMFISRQRRQQDTGFLAMMFFAIASRKSRTGRGGFFEPVRERFGDEAADGPPAVLRIILVFSMVSVFWALFDQHASTWITQAQKMQLHLEVPYLTFHWAVYGTISLAVFGGVWLFAWISNRRLPRMLTLVVVALLAAAGIASIERDIAMPFPLSLELKAEQLSALNPLMVMLIIPLLNFGVYRPLKRFGISVKPLQKMTVGMFLSALAFAVAAILQMRIESAGAGQVPVLWQVVQYLVMTTAEVLVSVTGLEFAYTQAPRAMKSTIMGFWLLCVTMGNVLVAFLAPMETILELSEFFWVFTVLMAGAAVIFAILAANYKGKIYLQESTR